MTSAPIFGDGPCPQCGESLAPIRIVTDFPETIPMDGYLVMVNRAERRVRIAKTSAAENYREFGPGLIITTLNSALDDLAKMPREDQRDQMLYIRALHQGARSIGIELEAKQ